MLHSFQQSILPLRFEMYLLIDVRESAFIYWRASTVCRFFDNLNWSIYVDQRFNSTALVKLGKNLVILCCLILCVLMHNSFSIIFSCNKGWAELMLIKHVFMLWWAMIIYQEHEAPHYICFCTIKLQPMWSCIEQKFNNVKYMIFFGLVH